jgi:hypothetical protein
MRSAPAILALVAALLSAGAAGAKVRAVKRLDGVAPGARVRIEGVVSMRGSTPLTILVLEIQDGEAVSLQPHTPAIEQELRNLDGVRIAAEGIVRPLLDATLPRLEVDRYDIVAVPGGGGPIIGMVSVEGGACILTTDEGRRYWIVGELGPALCEHAGARVWIVGRKTNEAPGNRPENSTVFTPTGYGVIAH